MSLWDLIASSKKDDEADAKVEARRKALHALTMGTAGALVALATLGAASGEEAKPAEKAPAPAPKGDEKKKKKHNWGMAIDMDSCTACGGCVVACQTENNVPAQQEEDSEKARGIFWMDLLSTAEGNYGEGLKLEVLPVPCMHCEDPPCVKVCPVNATYVSDEGIVAQVFDRCIGCRYCMSACPYGVRHFNWTEPKFDPAEQQSLNPDVACRPAGVVEKCTFCHHKIRAVKEKARADETTLTDNDFRKITACAAACPAQSITFGDLNDPQSAVSRLHKSPRAIRLLEELGTKPKVVYLRETKWRE
ncbi:MAG: molybdopterin oxidoreductase, iron-sulfur cluster-binding subunit [Myxococcaceae bacterium]|nr:molybdopterin oxidoreductase, iron-sulfur cluster-binding subunit [Myxococcaceae bacterium]